MNGSKGDTEPLLVLNAVRDSVSSCISQVSLENCCSDYAWQAKIDCRRN
jgi:hypothetical protein